MLFIPTHSTTRSLDEIDAKRSRELRDNHWKIAGEQSRELRESQWKNATDDQDDTPDPPPGEYIHIKEVLY